MHKIAKQSIVFFLVASLVFIPVATAAAADNQPPRDDISAGAMTIDLLLFRPLGAFALLLGSVVYIVSLPFSAGGENAGDAGKKLVVDPAKYTFKRKLGDF